MIRSVREMEGYQIHATDGEMGKLEQVYFDDDAWVVRYLVVNAGNWLEDRRVLISPIAVRAINWDTHQVDVGLTREQVKNSPDIDTHAPISRQNEIAFHQYYGWPFYWAGEGLWGGAMVPGALYGVPFTAPPPDISARQAEKAGAPAQADLSGTKDIHLRSTREVFGYRIRARDGEIGHLSDFLIEDESWRINYMVINTSNWWAGKKVIVPPTWVQDLNWADEQVLVDLKRETVKNSPEFNPETLVNKA